MFFTNVQFYYIKEILHTSTITFTYEFIKLHVSLEIAKSSVSFNRAIEPYNNSAWVRAIKDQSAVTSEIIVTWSYIVT